MWPQGKDPNAGLVKIELPLLGAARESGYESESLWAEPLGGNLYRVWNLPVFAYNVDMRAVVECREPPEGGLPVVTRVVEPGDCFVIRLFFSEAATEEQIQTVLDVLSARRALFEKANLRHWAVGLRTAADFDWVGPALEPHVQSGIVSFESAF
jgi:Domain of unknown function (DUF4265)